MYDIVCSSYVNLQIQAVPWESRGDKGTLIYELSFTCCKHASTTGFLARFFGGRNISQATQLFRNIGVQYGMNPHNFQMLISDLIWAIKSKATGLSNMSVKTSLV